MRTIYKLSLIIFLILLLMHCGCSYNLLQQGENYEKQKDYNSAIRSYEKIRAKGKQNRQTIEATIRIGTIYMKFGDYQGAIREFSLAKENLKDSDPAYAEVCYKLGYCYYEAEYIERAITEFKNAIELNDSLSNAYLYLGAAYLKKKDYGEAISALKTFLNKNSLPIARYNIAAAYWGQGIISTLVEAQKELELAEMSETNLQLKDKYREMRVAIEKRLEKISRKIVDLNLEKHIFACAYSYYNTHPIGTLTLKNNSEETMYDVQVIVSLKGYGDFPQELPFRDIPPNVNKEEQIQLFTKFDEKILNAPSGNVSVLVTLKYKMIMDKLDKFEKTESIEGTIFLHGKNSMTWNEPYSKMVAAFVTNTDGAVDSFARNAITTYRPFNKAIEIYNAMKLYGIKYSSDASPSENNIDRIYYPRQLLEFKKGDCDDLSVMFNACLENVGVRTAFIYVPGHVYVMFDTEVDLKNADDLFFSSEWYIQVRGSKHAWIPVEVTLLGQEGKSFLDAWEEGSRRYRRSVASGELQDVVFTAEAWQYFKPVSFPAISQLPSMPSREDLMAEYLRTMKDIEDIRRNVLEERIRTFANKLRLSPQNTALTNSLGVIYAKAGIAFSNQDYLDRSKECFEKAMLWENWRPAPYTNLANIILLESKTIDDLKEAERRYDEAIERGEFKTVYLNKMILYILMDDTQKASESYQKALENYTVDEIQTILGMSLEGFGIGRGEQSGRKDIVQSTIQSISKRPSDKTVNLDRLRDIMKGFQPIRVTAERKPDKPIDIGSTRSEELQMKELPLLLYWSEVRVE